MNILKLFLTFLADALGPDYEIVYYGLDEAGNGKVEIGELTVRNIHRLGDPMPSEIKEMIQAGKLMPNQYLVSQTTVFNQEKLANTSLLYLSDPKQGLNGVVAVNLIENKYFELIQEIMYMSNLDTKIEMPFSLLHAMKDEKQCIHAETAAEQTEKESVYDRTIAKMDEIIRRLMGNDVNDKAKYNPAKRRIIMIELEASGIFKVKGMISEAADRLFCSEVSIYRYLSDIRKE